MCEMCSLDSYLRQMGENVGDVSIRLDSYLRQIRGENVGDVIITPDISEKWVRSEQLNAPGEGLHWLSQPVLPEGWPLEVLIRDEDAHLIRVGD